MSVSKRTFLIGGASTIGLGTARSAFAAAEAGQVIGGLGDNEGLYVDLKEFKIHKGKVGATPAAQLARLEAKEVSDGAVIVRSGGKLYIVDAQPQGSTPQAMKGFWDSIPMPMR